MNQSWRLTFISGKTNCTRSLRQCWRSWHLGGSQVALRHPGQPGGTQAKIQQVEMLLIWKKISYASSIILVWFFRQSRSWGNKISYTRAVKPVFVDSCLCHSDLWFIVNNGLIGLNTNNTWPRKVHKIWIVVKSCALQPKWHQWSYMWVLASIGFQCMYWHVWWFVLWNVLVCIGMVCIMACIGMYYFWYVLHVLVSIGMYSEVICASIHMYWLVLACIEKWFVLYILVCIVMYWYILIYIDLYWMYSYVLVCMVCTGLYL